MRNTKNNNALYKLECMCDNPRFEGFGSVSIASMRGKRNLGHDFGPDDIEKRGRRWTAPRLKATWKPLPVEGRVRPTNDYPCVNLLIPAFSRRAVDGLGEMLTNNGELLPLVSSVGEYYAYNVTTVADVLDIDKSNITWFDEGRDIAMEINRYVCKPSALNGLAIFRIVESTTSTFVSQTFVDRAKECGLQGFNFIKLWPLLEGRTHREEEADNQKRNTTIKTKQGRRSIIGNSLVLRLLTTKTIPNRAEKQRAERLKDEVDSLLNDGGLDEYVGNLEGDEIMAGEIRLFFSCPDSDSLVKVLRPWLKTTNSTRKQLVKRNGEYDDPNCMEVVVRI